SVQRSVFVGDTQPSSRVRGVAAQLWEALNDPGGFPDKMRGIALVCVAVGVLVLLTRWSLERIVLVAGPTVLAVVAALINAYPFGGRFSLFLVPYLTIVVAVGVLELVSTGGRRLVVGGLVLLFVVAVPVGRTLGTAAHPPTRENVRPLLHVLDRSWRHGDTLYVYRNAQYALRFYAECLDCGVRPVPFPLRDAASGVDNAGTAAALASDPPAVVVGRGGPPPAQTLRSLDALRGRSRVWLLFSHVQTVASSLDE